MTGVLFSSSTPHFLFRCALIPLKCPQSIFVRESERTANVCFFHFLGCNFFFLLRIFHFPRYFYDNQRSIFACVFLINIIKIFYFFVGENFPKKLFATSCVKKSDSKSFSRDSLALSHQLIWRSFINKYLWQLCAWESAVTNIFFSLPKNYQWMNHTQKLH